MPEDKLVEKKHYDLKLPEITKPKMLLTKFPKDSKEANPPIDSDKEIKIVNEKKNLSQLVYVPGDEIEIKLKKAIKEDEKSSPTPSPSDTIKTSSPSEILIQSKNSKIEPRVVFSEKMSTEAVSLKSYEEKPKTNPSVIQKSKPISQTPVPEKSNTDWNALNKNEFYPRVIKFFSKNVDATRWQPIPPPIPQIPPIQHQKSVTTSHQTNYHYNQQQQQPPVIYNKITKNSPVTGSLIQRFFKSAPSIKQKTLEQSNSQQYGLERTFKQPNMSMQPYNNEHYAYKQRVQILRGNVLPSLGFFALKAAVALSLVYATSELGVWGASSKSKELWNQIVNTYNKRMFNVQPQRPVTVFDLYDGAKVQYNEMIKITMTSLQCMASITIKSINYILSK